MTDSDIRVEVLKLIENYHTRLSASWIVQSVISLRVQPKGRDADFWLSCAAGHVRAVVRQTRPKTPVRVGFWTRNNARG
jgi:hypothetical protein